MASQDDFPNYPTKASGEFGYQVARTIVGAVDIAVPLAGQGLQKVLDRYVGAPLEERREAWFILVGERLEDLIKSKGDVDFVQSPEFVETLLDATLAALKTRHQQKRVALANAVVNAAAGMTLNDVLRGAFISYVDRFSPYHLDVLRLLNNPAEDMRAADQAVHLLQNSQEGLLGGPRVPAEDEVVLVRVLLDLDREGLISSSLNQSSSTPAGALKRTTKVGEAFLSYITSP